MQKVRVAASMFAGCGGSSTGLQLAGYDVRYASEFVPTAIATYRANWPKTHVDTRDIRTVDARDVLPYATKIHYGGRGYKSADAPYPTITAIGHRLDEQSVLSTGGFIETRTGERRKLRIPELMRLFGFPRDYEFTGSFAKQWERLGRSHAPLQVYYVASEARRILEENA